MSKTKQQDLIINLLNDIPYRTEVLNSLSKEDRIELSTSIEAYQRLVKQRIAITGKLYGNKKKQAEDRELYTQQLNIRQRIYNIINK